MLREPLRHGGTLGGGGTNAPPAVAGVPDETLETILGMHGASMLRIGRRSLLHPEGAIVADDREELGHLADASLKSTPPQTG
jgi:hypothetical protein